jgi:RNA polymerase sigma factor (sigma-70 family)
MENESLLPTAKSQKTAFSNETDADLLTMISWREDEEEVALAAWGEFYLRQFRALTYICLKAYQRQIGESGVEDLVSETFLRVWTHGAATFRTAETDPDKLRKLITIWLSEIAKSLFLMQLRGRSRMPLVTFDETEHACQEATPLSTERQKQCEQLREVLDGLNARERDVLMARFSNYHRSGGKQQFDPEVLTDLAEKLQITKDSVRQILCRTLKKINLQLAPPKDAR